MYSAPARAGARTTVVGDNRLASIEEIAWRVMSARAATLPCESPLAVRTSLSRFRKEGGTLEDDFSLHHEKTNSNYDYICQVLNTSISKK